MWFFTSSPWDAQGLHPSAQSHQRIRGTQPIEQRGARGCGEMVREASRPCGEKEAKNEL